jgi:hypothetical protein
MNHQVYEDLLVARYTPDQQAEYDSLINATGDRFSIRNLLEKVKGCLEISPGMPLWGVRGYQRLVDARGLLNANQQINEELTSTLFTKNTFLIPVGADTTPTKKEGSNQGSGPATSAFTSSTANPSPATSSNASTPKPTTPPRDPTGQSRNHLADIAKGLADKNPEDEGMMKLANDFARMPIRSREVNAMLFAPPTPEEMEMIRRQMQR